MTTPGAYPGSNLNTVASFADKNQRKVRKLMVVRLFELVEPNFVVEILCMVFVIGCCFFFICCRTR